MAAAPPELTVQRNFLRAISANTPILSSYAASGLRTGSVICFVRELDPQFVKAFELAKAIQIEVGSHTSEQQGGLVDELSTNLQVVIENLPAIMNPAVPYLLPELLVDFDTLKRQVKKLKDVPGWQSRADTLGVALAKAIPAILNDSKFLDNERTLWPWRPMVADDYRRNQANGVRARDWEVASRSWESEARFGALAIAAQLRGVDKKLALEIIPASLLECLHQAPTDMRGMWMARCAFDVLPAKHHTTIVALAKTMWEKYQPQLTSGPMKGSIWVVKSIWQTGPRGLQVIVDPNKARMTPFTIAQNLLDLVRWGRKPRD